MKNFMAGLRKPKVAGWLLPSDANVTWIDDVHPGGGGGGGLGTRVDLSASCNGVTTVFALGSAPGAVPVLVSWNGILQNDGMSYSIVGANLTMVSVPQIGDSLEVIW